MIQRRIQTKLKSRSCRSRAKSSRRGESKDGPDEGAGGPTGSGCRSMWVRRMAGGQQLARLRQQCRTSWGGPGVVRRVLPGSLWHTLAGERTGQGAITQLVSPLLWVRVRELNPSSLWPFPWMVCPVRFGGPVFLRRPCALTVPVHPSEFIVWHPVCCSKAIQGCAAWVAVDIEFHSCVLSGALFSPQK